jgi:RNA polymerase sigma factor (sigma-70 family)
MTTTASHDQMSFANTTCLLSSFRETPMPNKPLPDSVQLRLLLERFQNGDQQAGEELFWATAQRLEGLVRHMLRDFPRLRHWVDTSDVLQGAITRLLCSLRSVHPTSTRDFFNLAATQIRRELLDLVRRFHCRPDARAVHQNEGGDDLFHQVPSHDGASSDDLELWATFHERVEQLPVEEREVVGLMFYHGWTHAQIAELFSVDERTIRRRWRSACRRLNEALGGRLPEV